MPAIIARDAAGVRATCAATASGHRLSGGRLPYAGSRMFVCPSCASPFPEGARFCPSCGHSLGVARGRSGASSPSCSPTWSGFTSQAERMDPEQVKSLVDGLFQRLVEDVTSFGGRVDKILGDAIVALFGAPVAHEDDAERAVRASLRMQRSITELVADLDLPIRMRIGVNTGEVLVGALRAGGDYTAMGDVVNTASRLQTAAPPGGVLVGPGDARRHRGRHRLRVRGRVPGPGPGRAAWRPGWRSSRSPCPAGAGGACRSRSWAGSSSCPSSSTPCGWPRASGGPSWPSSRARVASARPAWSRRCSTATSSSRRAPS